MTPYTIMLSLTLKDDITIYFTDDHSTKYYPVYKINQSMILLMIITLDGIMQHKPYSSQFNDKTSNVMDSISILHQIDIE